MRTLRAVAVGAALAAVAGCAPPPGAGEPAPVVVEAPGPDVPEDAAAFSGRWRGEWGEGASGALVVTRVAPDGAAEARLAGDLAPEGSIAATGRVAEGALELRTGDGGIAVFVMQPDGSLEGTWALDGTIRRGVFRRPAA